MTTADACILLVEAIYEISAARRERDVWRVIAQQAIHHTAGLTQRIDSLEAANARIREEYRFLRAQTMRRAEAA